MKKTKERKNYMKDFWVKLWNLLAPSQKNIKVLFFLIIWVEMIAVVGPYVLKLIIDKISNFNENEIKSIIILTILFFVVEQIASLFHYFKDKSILKIITNIESYLPIQAQEKLVNLSLNYHEKENTGNKIIKIEKGANRIIDLVSNMSWEVVPTMVQLFVTLSILFFVDWRFSLSFLFFTPLFIWLTYYYNKDLQPTRKKRHKNYEVASGKMGQSIININTVKSFVQEKREIKEFSTIRKKIEMSAIKEWITVAKFWFIRNIIVDLGRVVIPTLNSQVQYLRINI